MALSSGLNLLRRSLLSNPRPLHLCPRVQPRGLYSVVPLFRIAPLSTKAPLHPPRTTNPTPVLTFARGLRSAFERIPIRRIARSSRSSFSGGGNDFLEQWKRRINHTNPDYIFYAILGVNGLVFLMWGWAQENMQKFRDPEPLRFMFKHFTASWTNVLEGRIWTLLTACFSHEMTGHLLVNGMSFWFMAPPVMRMLGNSAFLALYLGGGVASSAFSLVWNAVIQHRVGNSHGASGAIYSVISLFACLFPNTTFLLFFIVPVPAWLCVSGIFAWDLYGSLGRRGGMTDSAGHVGGVLAGVAYFLRKRRGFGLRR